MILRRLENTDIGELKLIHEKFFRDEFDFDDLFSNSLSSLVVTDEENKIVCGGQVRLITEAVIISNKDIAIEERRQGFLRLLQAFQFCIASRGFDQLHAFVQDENWLRHLKNHGFKETRGKSLIIGI